MKTTICIVVFLLASVTIWSQEFEINGVLSTSNSNEFEQTLGFGFGYNRYINSSRIGLNVSYLSTNKTYAEIRSETVNPEIVSYYQFIPDTRRYSTNISYAYKALERGSSGLYVGAYAGLNFFTSRGEYSVFTPPESYISSVNYYSTSFLRPGLGLILEYELNKIISEHISTSIRISPEITSNTGYGSTGASSLRFISWLNTQICLKYRL